MPSLRHQLLASLIPRVRKSRDLDSEPAERARVEAWHRSLDRTLPTRATPGFARHWDVSVTDIGFPSHVLTPRERRVHRTLYYVHGGGFMAPIDGFHVRYATRLAHAIGARIVMPDYPLAPEHTWADSHDALVADAGRWSEQEGGIVLAGDSAGGGLALAMALSMRDRGLRPATRLVMHAPWVDLTTSTPETRDVDAIDPWLFLSKVEAYARWWAGPPEDLGRPEVLDRFADLPSLLDHISMCDVYATPYLNEAQMTSGTLACSFGMGRAIVSTPYWHALEVLADGRGTLVPFGDSTATGIAIADLLTDAPRRTAMQRRAYADSRPMIWARSAEHHLASFAAAAGSGRPAAPRRPVLLDTAPPGPGAGSETAYLSTLCDDTGVFQHAIHTVPDRSHGYCVDDNARALLLAVAREGQAGDVPLPVGLALRFAAFVQHAWNPQTRRFRNFMGFDRRWLEETGSEDSHGRTLWALGATAASPAQTPRRDWAAALFAEASPAVEGFSSPRAWAFTLLGLAQYRRRAPDDAAARRLQARLAGQLVDLLAAVEGDDWVWFEDGLAYDNARLPEALLVTAAGGGGAGYAAAGLRSLRWLAAVQTAGSGDFRPVGSDSFGTGRTPPRPFDQQPLEAAATVSACFAAWRLDGDGVWMTEAERAFAWFHGANDLRTPLVDPLTGACRDGLHPDRANENRGAESVLSHLLALTDIRALRALGARRSAAPGGAPRRQAAGPAS